MGASCITKRRRGRTAGLQRNLNNSLKYHKWSPGPHGNSGMFPAWWDMESHRGPSTQHLNRQPGDNRFSVGTPL